MIRALRKLRIEGMYLNIVTVYEKPIVNIILIRETLKTISPKIRNETRCPLSPLLFNTILEFLARPIRQEEEIKGVQTDKETI
jgi:hypothetical protein